MTIVYCANRTLYQYLPTTINSLLANNEDKIKKIYLLIEDDDVSYINHPKIEFINCNQFDFLVREGINCSRRFPYMAMVRCFLSKILKEPRILYLDVDTIVDGNIFKLWNDYNSELIVAREEYDGYFNSGVLLMNLSMLRALNYENVIYKLLTNCKFIFPDQDVLNMVFKNRIAKMDIKYNVLGNDEVYKYPIIIRHFAGIIKPWKENANEKNKAIWKKYETDRIMEE